jgi:hypothetical protein
MDIKAYIDECKLFHTQYIKFFEDIRDYYDCDIQVSKNSYNGCNGHDKNYIEICINKVVFILHEEDFCAFDIDNITSEQFIERVNNMLDAKNVIESIIDVDNMSQCHLYNRHELIWKLIDDTCAGPGYINIHEDCDIYFYSISNHCVHANFNEIYKIIDYITENCPQYLRSYDIKIALK